MYSYDKNDVATLKSVDIRSVDKSSLVDLNSVHIDESKPVQERVLSFTTDSEPLLFSHR